MTMLRARRCLVLLVFFLPTLFVHAGSSSRSSSSNSRTSQVLLDRQGVAHKYEKYSNVTNPFRLFSPDEMERERQARKRRVQARKEKAKEFLKNNNVKPPPREQLERVSDEDLEKMMNNNRKLGNWWGGSDAGAYSSGVLADPSQYYDKWAQAYRMLGGFIDCDHDKDDSSGSGDNNNNNNNNDNGNYGGAKEAPCSRWMMWASYVNPNYQGNAYYEYFGDSPTGVLDCHNPDTDWVLLGVYRQEFYQFLEQISKHLWAIDDYEYIVALAGLAYMTDYDCFQVGEDNSGNAIYAGVAPQEYGMFQMALYTDEYCLTPNDSLGMTYDDFGLQSDIDLGSKDDTDDDGYSWAYDDWYNSQEYTLTNMNDVYEEYKYCTSCVDWPTYQDGYFIGDDGTDDDDLINQCWKFYSHDSFTCEADCIAMAHSQGTILSVQYGDTTFGQTMDGFYQMRDSATGELTGEGRFQRLLANTALTASFLLFVATFLAFAVARRSRYRESKSSRSRRLLDDDDGGRSRKSRKSSSRSRVSAGDGLFKERGSSRSKSGTRKTRSSGRSGSKHRSSSKKKRSRSYDPPKETVSPRTKSSAPAEEYF